MASRHRSELVPKECSKCRQVLGEEHWRPSAWKKHAGYCRTCSREYYAGWKAEGGTTLLAKYTRERRQRLAAMVMDLKAQKGCMYCGESHPAALDFHHRDKDAKVLTVRQMVDRTRTVEVIMAEIDKCDLVCSNCHRKLHFVEGSTAYWGDKQYSEHVIREAEKMRERRNAKYPVELKMAQ